MPCPCCGPKPCCCVDGVLSEIFPPNECEGTSLPKPDPQRDLSVVTITVEWCDLTITLTQANSWSDDSGQVALAAAFDCVQPGDFTLEATKKRLTCSASVTWICNHPVFTFSGETQYYNDLGNSSTRLFCDTQSDVCIVPNVYQCGGEGSWCPDSPCPDLPTITINWAP